MLVLIIRWISSQYEIGEFTGLLRGREKSGCASLIEEVLYHSILWKIAM